MPPLFLVMFPGEAPESYIAPASRLYPPFGRVIFCRRRRQSLGVRAARARFYSDAPQRCHSVAPPYKNVPPLFLVMFPGEAPESYIAPASRLYPPFGRVIFCRRRRQSLGVRAVRARFYSDVPQRCHSVAPPHKNVPPRAALLNILSPKGDEIFHTRKARISPPRSGDFTRRLIEPPYFTAKPSGLI